MFTELYYKQEVSYNETKLLLLCFVCLQNCYKKEVSYNETKLLLSVFCMFTELDFKKEVSYNETKLLLSVLYVHRTGLLEGSVLKLNF